ncbi:MAG: rhodanese-like domain-containing protein [Planctomycetes bacterium]|nr:rhodanese-like domain-containing protein [Planctomycetota bacterium]
MRTRQQTLLHRSRERDEEEEGDRVGVKRIDPDRANELLNSDQGYVYIDVRMPEEYVQGHVPDAHNIPVMIRGQGGVGLRMNPEFVETVTDEIPDDCRIILGCQKGGRSQKAADLLSEAGFTNLHDMRGGFVGETDVLGNVTFPGWSSRGLPTTRR